MPDEYQPLKGILTEDELINFIGVTKNQLSALRHAGLPFVAVNNRVRLYFEDDLIKFFKGRLKILTG